MDINNEIYKLELLSLCISLGILNELHFFFESIRLINLVNS
jgi:hypothetical protein